MARVLVTGGRRGIGRAIALALAAEGHDVAVNAEVGGAELDGVADEIAAQGRASAALVADLADLDSHAGLLAAAEAALGPLDVLVNNAGVGVLQRGDPLDVSPESFDRCMGLNARAMFFLSQRFARGLLARPRPAGVHCCIVNITSCNAVAVALNRAEYTVSKAAAHMVSQAFAARLAGEGIGVYEIQPGVIATDMTAPVLEDYRARIAAGLTLAPRVGTPEEVGAVVASLASGRFDYATGQAIRLDGGLLLPRF